eukprot:scaffold1221_cov207-Amphora_coffeaeformis.AAC.24
MALVMSSSAAARAKMVSPLAVLGIMAGHRACFTRCQLFDDEAVLWLLVCNKDVVKVGVPVLEEVVIVAVVVVEYHETCSNCCDKKGNVTTKNVKTKTIPQ